MTPSHSDAAFPEEALGFDSRDSEVLIVDGPGDRTVRPPSQRLLPFLMSEREKLVRLHALETPLPAPERRPEDREEKRN